ASVLKAANAYKTKGVPVSSIFFYLFSLIFDNRSMYMDILTGKNEKDFAKDTVYRFMKSCYEPRNISVTRTWFSPVNE
ncbi:MAG: transposase IS4 family protein, partial [Halanaerobium sp. T82-1]